MVEEAIKGQRKIVPNVRAMLAMPSVISAPHLLAGSWDDDSGDASM
eukprot:CAMPEP_0204517438 /NCGR_PEP_ID=MMETSP0661-20131031/3668_1 /ASSEMBLY_ACC=CAM_ASM_000606 /TAXON_ID=109239 /ORGANISM="Alexandrium margalefi, Strain AMGDE01CS-322" /LENGTH=45 /DNA_ID= /DNA_START= /DNA_END= /DNA_ORIENTATION=